MAQGFLPVDIVTDILSRLPAKSLVRFRWICKQWDSLIYNPYFVERHEYHMINGATSRILFFCGTKYNNEIKLYAYEGHSPRVTCSSSYKIRFTPMSLDGSLSSEHLLELPFPELSGHQMNGHLRIGRKRRASLPLKWSLPPKQSPNEAQQLVMSNLVNGLICAYDPHRRDCAYLLNPFTRDRELVKLPKGDVEHGLDRIASYGFGFDVSSGKYKLVRISINSTTGNQFGEVFILGTGEWRYLGKTADCVIPGSRPKYVRGTLCWNTSSQFRVLTFDIMEESFGVISMLSLLLSESCLQIRSYQTLCGCGENLYVIVGCALNPNSKLRVMVLKDFVTAQWTYLCDIDASSFLESSKAYYVQMLGMENEKIMLVACDFTDNPQVLVLCYDTCSRSVSKLYEDQVYHYRNFDFCTESLLSPKMFIRRSKLGEEMTEECSSQSQ